MAQQQIAVILLNWNGITDTRECIQSLKESAISVTVYIVDNASKDNQAEKIQAQFPNVKVLSQQENLGFCEGNNVGIRQALKDGASHVVILNNDTLVPPDAIEVLYKKFVSVKGIGAISPVIMQYPDTDIVWFAKAKWNEGRAQFNMNPERVTLSDLENAEDVWATEFACGCCLFTSAEVLNKVGLLDNRYFAYYDEADWCKRLEKAGYKSFVTSETHIYHKVSKSAVGLVSVYLMTRNRLLWMKENLPKKVRLKSFMYLNKEFIWHTLNVVGLVNGQYTKAHSKAYLRAVTDFRMGRFGRWNKKTETIIFKANKIGS